MADERDLSIHVVVEEEKREKPPGKLDPEVHRYLTGAFSRLSSEIADSIRASQAAAGVAREALGRVERIEWHLFGSKPPPPPPPEDAVPEQPLRVAARLSGAELDGEALEAATLVHAAKLADDERARVEDRARIARVESELRAQSAAMGIAPPLATKAEVRSTFLDSRAGRSFVMKLATLILASLTTIATAYIAVTLGRAPSVAPAPALPASASLGGR